MRYSFPLQSWSAFLFPNKITELVILFFVKSTGLTLTGGPFSKECGI